MDMFDTRLITPMLVGVIGEAFDDPDWIFELKLDGARGLAYLDPGGGTELRNKRNLRVDPIYPELSALHRQVRSRCILDGELICTGPDGKPDFSALQRRALMKNSLKIKFAAEKTPVSFVVYDILYLDGRDLTGLPLMERKAALDGTFVENDRLTLSRYTEGRGIPLYRLTAEQELEGIVAKRRASRYSPGKRTKDWIKIKHTQDDDFVVCGYLFKERGMASLILGQYRGNELQYMGHVTLGVRGRDFLTIQAALHRDDSPFPVTPEGNRGAVWIEPRLVCTVQYMHRTEAGGIRHPIFKGLRHDKAPHDCREVTEACPTVC